MVNRTHTARRGPLLDHCTSQRALRRAWEIVKGSALSSGNAETRKEAAEFQVDPDKAVKRLQRRIRTNAFRFEPQQGVLKRSRRKAGEAPKEPRPIVIAPVDSRVVQRGILDCLQSTEPRIRRHLGKIPDILATPTSVGGLPGRGVPEAISIIKAAIGDGAKRFIRSDLRKFFQHIDKTAISQFMAANIDDDDFLHLFADAVKTELANEDEIGDYLRLFPIGETGVPQGSSLSALCANILLREFDSELNQRGITCVRYLDDFVILGKDRRSVDRAWHRATGILRGLGLEWHDPASGSGKASAGKVSDGFEFLSFSIDDKRILPSRKVRSDMLNDLRSTIRNAKASIRNTRGSPRRAEPRFIQCMTLIDLKVRGWGDAFAPTTDNLIFSQLDRDIDKLLDEFRRWFAGYVRHLDERDTRRAYGVALLTDRKSSIQQGFGVGPIGEGSPPSSSGRK